MVWDPEQYRRGNFFQQQVNESFRKRFPVEPQGNILDVGCGDGQYSRLLADTFQHSQILGIDSSSEMITHARQHWAGNNLAFEVARIEDFQRPATYDFILSFWCLHWTKIELSFPNIFAALKPGGRLYAVFSSFSVNSISQVWQELAGDARYTALANKINQSGNHHKQYFLRVLGILNKLPFRHVNLTSETTRVLLPDMSYFQHLLLAMPFMKTIPADMHTDFINDMAATFASMCQRQYAGDLYYETRPIFLHAIKESA